MLLLVYRRMRVQIGGGVLRGLRKRKKLLGNGETEKNPLNELN